MGAITGSRPRFEAYYPGATHDLTLLYDLAPVGFLDRVVPCLHSVHVNSALTPEIDRSILRFKAELTGLGRGGWQGQESGSEWI